MAAVEKVSKKSSWSAEEVERIVLEVVEDQLQDVEYEEGMVSQWVSSICEECSRRLIELKKPFKYIVQAAVLQHTGAGLHATSCCFWDTAEDAEDLDLAAEVKSHRQGDNRRKHVPDAYWQCGVQAPSKRVNLELDHDKLILLQKMGETLYLHKRYRRLKAEALTVKNERLDKIHIPRK